MIIGIDARPLSWDSEGGISTVCNNLISQVVSNSRNHEVIVFSNKPVPIARNIDFKVHILHGGVMEYSLKKLPKALRLYNCEVLLCLSPEIFRKTIPTVLLVYDIYPLMYQQWLSPKFMLHYQYWRHQIPTRMRLASIKKLNGVLAISERTVLDIREHSKGIKIPIRVARPAASSKIGKPWGISKAKDYLYKNYRLDSPFFLYVGGINRQKNIRTLLRAAKGLRGKTGNKTFLVIIGRSNWPTDNINDLANEPGVLHIENVSEYDLGAFYTAARALVHLSFYEGFGLPVIEAMSCGTPVIVSNRGSLPEVCGEAGIIVEPIDIKAIILAMEKMAFDADEYLRRRELSFLRSVQFSWKSMAEETLDMLEEVTSL